MNLFNHHFVDLEGLRLYLDRYRNQPFLVVNIATESRFTPQLTALQRIYGQHRAAGLVVLGIPCTDFEDEPRSDEEIAEFLRTEYVTNFPVTASARATGPDALPLFQEILQEHGRRMLPRQSFCKYLFDRKGELVENWPPEVLPDDPGLINSINRYLTSRAL